VRNLDDGLSSQHIGHRALTAQKMSFKLRLTNTYVAKHSAANDTHTVPRT